VRRKECRVPFEQDGGRRRADPPGSATLVITFRAVEKYVSSIFGKLGIPSSGAV
jgi:hypothetical protein